MSPAQDQLEPALTRWPLHAALELGALATTPGCGRAWTRQIAWEWRLSRLASSTELIVSELVTNAVQASHVMRQAAVRIWLVSDRAQVVVFVRDASPQPPVLADLGEDAENGRGLLLIEAVSERWGHFGYDSGGRSIPNGTLPSPSGAGSGASSGRRARSESGSSRYCCRVGSMNLPAAGTTTPRRGN